MKAPARHLFPGLLLLACSLLLLPSRHFPWLRPVERAAMVVVHPALLAFSYVEERVLAALRSLFYFNTWERRFRQLQAQNWTLTNELVYLRQLYADSEEEQSQRRSAPPASVIAKISATLQSPPATMWLIDKGSADGIEKNLPVLGHNGRISALVGKVFQTNRHSSVIIPLVHPLGGVSARLQESQFSGLVKGGNGTLHMLYINRLAQGEILPGELVVSAGLEGSLFPAGLPIGKVIRVDDSGFEASISLQLTPLLDISQLRYLQIQARPKSET